MILAAAVACSISCTLPALDALEARSCSTSTVPLHGLARVEFVARRQSPVWPALVSSYGADWWRSPELWRTWWTVVRDDALLEDHLEYDATGLEGRRIRVPARCGWTYYARTRDARNWSCWSKGGRP